MDKIYGRYCCIAIFDKPVDLGLPEIYSNIIATIAPVDGLWCVSFANEIHPEQEFYPTKELAVENAKCRLEQFENF